MERNEGIKETVIAQAEEKIKWAYATTPAHYHHHLMLLDQRKNLGTRERPNWVSFQTPYMTVDGRVKMASDEAAESGHAFNIDTQFMTVGDTLICKAVAQTCRGRATGHVKVNIGGSGVDASNPFENAETSAVGRALGFVGYGVFGQGIASADEVIEARGRAAKPLTGAAKAASDDLFGGEPTPEAPTYDSARKGTPPTEAQLVYLRKLCENAGWAVGETEAFITDHVANKIEASDAIEKLKNHIDPRGGSRTGMTNQARKGFFSKAGHLGRWKDWQPEVRKEIARLEWGTPTEPETTKMLDQDQQGYLLGYVSALPSPTFTELFGEGKGWDNITRWASSEAISLSPWDLAIYISDKKAPESARGAKPEQLGEDIIEELEDELISNGDGLLDEITEYCMNLRGM